MRFVGGQHASNKKSRQRRGEVDRTERFYKINQLLKERKVVTFAALREGLPQENAYFGVLRQALAIDRLEPAGVYFGTSGGALYASSDEGDRWQCLAQHLPSISSVETLVIAD